MKPIEELQADIDKILNELLLPKNIVVQDLFNNLWLIPILEKLAFENTRVSKAVNTLQVNNSQKSELVIDQIDDKLVVEIKTELDKIRDESALISRDVMKAVPEATYKRLTGLANKLGTKITTEGTAVVWHLNIIEKLTDNDIRITLEQKKINSLYEDLTDKINEVVEFTNGLETQIEVAKKMALDAEKSSRSMEERMLAAERKLRDIEYTYKKQVGELANRLKKLNI